MSDLIHMNGRLPAKKGKDLCTRDEAVEIAQKVAELVSEHLAKQIPGLVGTIVEAALRAYDESVRAQPEPSPVTFVCPVCSSELWTAETLNPDIDRLIAEHVCQTGDPEC